MKRTLERVLFGAARRLDRPVEAVLRLPRVRSLLQHRARRSWRATATPLILCYGNINRSAFAAALARQRGREGARSAGFYPVPDRPAPDRTVACAAEYGVELGAHRSTRVTRDDTSRATAIFVFDLQNLARVAALDPRALARTHFVGALDDDQRVLIADPHGRGQEVLESTLARIAHAIDHADATPRAGMHA